MITNHYRLFLFLEKGANPGRIAATKKRKKGENGENEKGNKMEVNIYLLVECYFGVFTIRTGHFTFCAQ